MTAELIRRTYLENLQDGQVVRLRTGKAGEHDVEWSEWYEAPLYVQRNKKGEVVIITIKNSGWAEYNPKYDYRGNGLFTGEDYYMEIDGL